MTFQSHSRDRAQLIPGLARQARSLDAQEKVEELINDISLHGLYRDIYAFHQKFGVACPKKPTFPSKEIAALRKRLILEEAQEAADALDSGDLAHTVHECIDSIVVALGTLIACGVHLDGPWQAIHKANMSKEKNPDGGKIRKPPGWIGADMMLEVEKQMVAAGREW